MAAPKVRQHVKPHGARATARIGAVGGIAPMGGMLDILRRYSGLYEVAGRFGVFLERDDDDGVWFCARDGHPVIEAPTLRELRLKVWKVL